MAIDTNHLPSPSPPHGDSLSSRSHSSWASHHLPTPAPILVPYPATLTT